MIKKLYVDKNTCLGCGTCVAMSPKVFKMGSDGKAEVISMTADSEENINNAIQSCPVGAIKKE